jgi:hypothetical protein
MPTSVSQSPLNNPQIQSHVYKFSESRQAFLYSEIYQQIIVFNLSAEGETDANHYNESKWGQRKP